MSNYNRGPNVSQYIANLNTITQSNGVAQDQIPFDDDLALFTNSELFDFSLGDVKQEDYAPKDGKSKSGTSDNVEYNPTNYAIFDPSQPMPHLSTNFPGANFDPQLFQSPQSATFPSHNQAVGAASPTSSQAAGQKRVHSTPSSPASDDNARVAAEEDKRRRNTAASARFRVKKKQREAALEKSAKENADRVDSLQKRVVELEMENKWLRNLVVQKDGKPDASSTDAAAIPATIAGKQAKKGVGTENAA